MERKGEVGVGVDGEYGEEKLRETGTTDTKWNGEKGNGFRKEKMEEEERRRRGGAAINESYLVLRGIQRENTSCASCRPD